jgi:competence protein ComEA
MPAERMERLWFVTTVILIVIIIASSIVIYARRDNGQLIILEAPNIPVHSGEIHIEGAVNNPGTYILKPGDQIDEIIQASGGMKENADMKHMYLSIPYSNEETTPQKVNINRAESWLLQALPGIGEVRAQAIIDYRLTNGFYHSPEDLREVPGINTSTFEKIKEYITVSE